MNNIKKDIIEILLAVVLMFLLVFLMMFGVNSCSADIWNNGICSNCDTKYELKAASNGLKYYSCPDCGVEVTRY